MLIILTETQKNVLEKFSSEKLCIDSTHGTNQYSFNLTTIIVNDEFGEGYPTAFCISLKINKVHMTVFFSKIKEVTGSFTPNVFMSDDAPAFWNAWIKIMSPIPEFHILCKWHIDNNWRKNLKKIDGSLTTKAYVYKTLRILLDESNIIEFENLLSFFLCKLEEEFAMHNFRAYFVSTYVPRKKLWAACYRCQVMLITNMVLEAIHKTLKHVYLKGKKNNGLMLYCGIYSNSHFVNVINNRHCSALQTNYKVTKISDNTWSIASNSSEPSNKNVNKQLRTKAPEEQRVNKPTLQVINQIKNDLKGNDTVYINIDPHYERSYGQPALPILLTLRVVSRDRGCD
ncbi:hypothetical protein AGLY_016453 [Aphis glycines]|uniref:ZSWIM1/3 RNaseH-like domain-containing protein n=1 Tax=Aphis glycines TaxID=307491 RepID=A0A6G0SXT8_APHGL|nr:hypothetical protein AGLY_016453 [Aphis glycines]